MSVNLNELLEAYLEKSKLAQTWSGIPVKEAYGPQDVKGNNQIMPGSYPFTRGIHPNMYKGKLWTRREICGHSSAEETNKRIKYLFSTGQSGINVIFDQPTASGIDSDHPYADGSIGVVGVPSTTVVDMELMMQDIPLNQVSTTFSTCVTPIFAQYIIAAEKRGINPAELRGTILNDHLHYRYAGWGDLFPVDVGDRWVVDSTEYAIRNVPHWHPLCSEGYDFRETGINAIQEVAFTFAVCFHYIEKFLERGLDIDEVAPRLSFTFGVHIDFFEEIAKFRAARRLWARTLKEKYGARKDSSLKLKFHVNTAGCSAVRQEPLNNLLRFGFESLAAVLGGAQSLHTTSYDEPIALPTEESHRLAVRTQQIIAYETGVAAVADPLGGSYYVEHLTDKLEEEIEKSLKEIEDIGGMARAVEIKWIDQEIEKAAYKYQQEVETGKRVIVGRNAFALDEDQEDKHTPHRVVQSAVEKHLQRVKEIKQTRDQKRLLQALDALAAKAQRKNENMMPEVLNAVRCYATLQEIGGVVRQVYGYSYDPFGVVESPF